jgi:Spy/CpxP family protein refolding chaperone
MKNKLSIAAVLSMAAVFCSGVVLGALGHRLYTANSVTAAAPRQTPEEWRKKFKAEMQGRLNLQADQMTKLDVILDDTRDKFRAARDEGKAKMKEIHQSQVAQVNAMLDERQRVEYAKMLAEREAKAKEREKQGPPPPPQK